MIERNFSSAHQLRGYKGKCENLHGHNYKIEIYARGRELDNIGLLVDFVELKAAADEVVQYLDHRNINELDPFVELQPSAENLAKYVLERVAAKVGDERVQIYKVRCFETPTSVATYEVSRQSAAGVGRGRKHLQSLASILFCLTACCRLPLSFHASSAIAGMVRTNTGVGSSSQITGMRRSFSFALP